MFFPPTVLTVRFVVWPTVSVKKKVWKEGQNLRALRPAEPEGHGEVGDIEPPGPPSWRREASWVPGGARRAARARPPHRAGVLRFRVADRSRCTGRFGIPAPHPPLVGHPAASPTLRQPSEANVRAGGVRRPGGGENEEARPIETTAQTRVGKGRAPPALPRTGKARRNPGLGQGEGEPPWSGPEPPPSLGVRRRLFQPRSAPCDRVCAETGNDPSAGSPTETLLRLLLPLDSQV